MNTLVISILSVLFGIFCIVYMVLKRWNFFKMWKESGLSWLSFHPYWGSTYCKFASDDQKEKAFSAIEFAPKTLSEEDQRKKFREFLMTLPTYCIQDSFFSGLIKRFLERGGARFKKVVLIDSSSVDDSYVSVRCEGDYFISNGGFYFIPWDNAKTILYWDINDSRPLIDKSKEAKWYDPRMNARYVYGMWNKLSMQNKKENEGVSTTMLIIGLVIVLVVIGASAYYTHQDSVGIKTILNNISIRLGA